jgi:UDP-3-O-[3-hydroxymyristoyl] glucosamine N-acyltransferase
MKLKDLMSWDSQLELVTKLKNDCEVTTLIPIDSTSLKAGGLGFIKDKKFLEKALELSENPSTSEVALVLTDELFEKNKDQIQQLESRFMALLSSKNVALSIALLSKPFYEIQLQQTNDIVDARQMGSAQVSPMADIAQDVFLGKGVVVKAGAKIHSGARILSNCVIGEDCEIFPNVTLYPFCRLGKRVRLHSGCVLGADGFGHEFHEGVHLKVWHVGGVEIGDDVEIGAGSCVDRATMGVTRIGSGTKIDNHVQIGHNCQVGRGVIICGQSGLSGSVQVGDFTVLGGKAGVGPGVIIGKACQIAGSAMVAQGEWPDGSKLGGHPARPYKEWMKGLAYIRRQSLK